MKNPIMSTLVGLIAVVLTTTAWGFDIGQSKTEAGIVVYDGVTPAIHLNFKSELSNNGFADLVSVDLAVTWVLPEPILPSSSFKVLIPAGCFITNGVFHVGDFRACGVQMTADFGRGAIALSISEFETVLKLRRGGSANFTMEARFTDLDREAAIIGILGGGSVEIAIGSESMTALPSAIETELIPPEGWH
jgi:hypothetical protein